MLTMNNIFSFFRLFLTALVVFSVCTSQVKAEPDVTIAGYTKEKALELGKQLYNEGMLPSGKPARAFVMGDIPVAGSMFSCESCHQRSGLGSIEANYVVPPVNGRMLYAPLRLWDTWNRHSNPSSSAPDARKVPSFLLADDLRPAYTDESLARLMREGIDPSGKVIDQSMPVYDLSDTEMSLLTYYLKNISSDYSPGVTDSSIRFATVVTEGADPVDKESMLSVLKAVIKDRNAQTRNQSKRSKRGAFVKREMDVGYRNLTLALWELKGTRDTWADQLEAYYKKEPVFALLGGIAEGDWKPIHDFSEKHNVPCIFPITDRPVISSSDWNTLYFSKGFYQEGEGAAKYLRRNMDRSGDGRIVQIFREGTAGADIALGFEETWHKFRRPSPETIKLSEEQSITEDFWNNLLESQSAEAVLFWMDKKELAKTDILGSIRNKPSMIFVSSGLLGEYAKYIPYKIRNVTHITHPYSIPGDKEKNRAVLKRWLKIRNIPVSNIRIQSKMYFLGWLMAEAVMHMRSEYYRDYFLEAFDMMTDQRNAIAVYPVLSFGPGQRYASKGCYIVQLSKERKPVLIKKSAWVIH
jgi:hypothetical protein